MTNEKLSTSEKDLAKTLFKAYSTGKALDMTEYSDVVTDDASAYRVQDYLTELKDEKIGGYKVSLTSKETQDLFDADAPLYGAQIDSHVVQGPHTFDNTKLMEPLAEVELVFRAKEELSRTDSLEELLNKTLVAPAIEVPDSRFSDWFPALPKHLVMADAAVGGYIVYGTEKEASSVFSSVEQVANVHCQLFQDDVLLKDGVSTEVLGNPLNSLHWLTEKLATQGQMIEAGQLVSSGTFLLPEKLTAGKWKAVFDNGLGEVNLSVVE
ncbi:2-keto-4-pentenoate hydratase [Ligilactobacillus pobuzihii]|uniref:2-keto-4-pentenoate hydratase n=1 Tax=Ligilactobacillus pobuzihii TaxID=449659 RepID=A0A0R2LJT3_9LACO|nr:hypothetical protein [Ligilactobacillus pobuzihii]KRK10259.1 2-keto-4-pentenoate hydratase [Ligilactobacillus pobuzihii E100301 = KCTC 13174]KRO02068.1 2-keto-4-pentenoate hydratase [Ligilactobacillus pobuzihii]GEN48174.1 2-keto-4-pentenoate hydratase [Ligilactobacillus pobuzihii]